jgi:HEAT repeat protein
MEDDTARNDTGESANETPGSGVETAESAQEDEPSVPPSAETTREESSEVETPRTSLDEALVDDLQSVDDRTREEAVRRLASLVEGGTIPAAVAMESLREHDDDESPAVRAAVCDALGVLGTDAARERLEAYRLDPDAAVSRTATRTIRTLER